MVDKKLSELASQSISDLSGDYHVVVGGVNKRISGDALIGSIPFDTVANWQADTNTYADGTYIEYGGYRGIVDSTATEGFIENSATTPVKLKVLLTPSGQLSAHAFGTVHDGVTSDAAEIQKLLDREESALLPQGRRITVREALAAFLSSRTLGLKLGPPVIRDGTMLS